MLMDVRVPGGRHRGDRPDPPGSCPPANHVSRMLARLGLLIGRRSALARQLALTDKGPERPVTATTQP